MSGEASGSKVLVGELRKYIQLAKDSKKLNQRIVSRLNESDQIELAKTLRNILTIEINRVLTLMEFEKIRQEASRNKGMMGW